MSPSAIAQPGSPSQPTWQSRVAAKQTYTAAQIPTAWRLPVSPTSASTITQSMLDVPQSCGLLTPRELTITESYEAHELVAQLAAGSMTSVEVTTAFAKRAAIAQQLTGCLTETFFPEALRRAAELDEHLAKVGSPIGPLHGLPVSIKDSFNVEGVPTTLGLVKFIDRVAEENSALVKILLEAGAVLYVKTNVPQTMMTAESHNNVFGRTVNPHNALLGSGGSSGGEGALVAMRGSPLGIGTDIAGSIRIPALCCGTVGFKPSAGRVPYGGQASCHRLGSPGIIPSAGPLCHSVRDAELLLKAVFNANSYELDDTAVLIPWRDPHPLPVGRPVLRIGIVGDDPELPVHPPMQKALATAMERLKAAGHHIIDITAEAPAVSDVSILAFRYFYLDPLRSALQLIADSGEPRVPSVAAMYSQEDATADETGLGELFDMNAARGRFQADTRKVWARHQLDIILCPGYQGGCAQPHETYGYGSYTVGWNLLDHPACVIPFGEADEKADAAYVRKVKYQPAYNAKAVQGAPCHVQLVGKRLMDEELLRCALEVERVLKS